MAHNGQVHIVDNGVWLYTHRGGGTLFATVAQALSRRERWDDPAYLARIIFDEMIDPADRGRAVGYGIDTQRRPDVDEVVHVNCDGHQVIVVEDANGDDGWGEKHVYSFDQFILDWA